MADPNNANGRLTLEQTLGVLGLELQELTGGTTNLGQDERDAPDLALVAETVLSSELPNHQPAPHIPLSTHLELSIETGRLERATGDLVANSSSAQLEQINKSLTSCYGSWGPFIQQKSQLVFEACGRAYRAALQLTPTRLEPVQTQWSHLGMVS